MPKWVVVEIEFVDDPLPVSAPNAKEAAKQVVSSGPYFWTKPPPGWESAPSVELDVADDEGSIFSVRVYGPL